MRLFVARFSCLFSLFLFVAEQLSAQSSSLLHLPFNNTTADKSGNDLQVKPFGNLTSTRDRFGNSCKAMQLSDGAYLSVDVTQLSLSSTAITVATWFKPVKSAIAANEIQVPILSKGSVSELGSLNVSYTQSFQQAKAEVVFTSDFRGEDKSYTSHRLEYDKWYHFAIVLDEGWVQAYLNGKPIWLSMYNKKLFKGGDKLFVGRSLSGTTFSGVLDDLHVFERALSAFEVNKLFTDEADKVVTDVFTIKMPADITLPAIDDKCHAIVKFQNPTVELSCGTYKLLQTKGAESGSLFNVGKTSVVFEATSDAGKVVSGSFNIFIEDKQQPLLTCPSDLIVVAPPASLGVEVAYPEIIVSDNCPGLKLKLENGKPSDEFFPLGNTVVKYSATDASGNRTECSFNVRVNEDLNPVTKCTPDQLYFTTREKDIVPALYDIPEFQIRGKKLPMLLTAGPQPGALLKTGTYNVSYSLKGTEVGDVQCSFSIEVRDTIKPTIKCGVDLKATAITEGKGAKVSYTLPTATDGGKAVTVNMMEGLPSGSEFPVGVTKVKYEATDASGNSAYCQFLVRVEPAKVQPSVVQVPVSCLPNIDVNADSGKPGAVVNFTLPAVFTEEGVKLVQTSGLPSGSFYPVGTTKNAFSATDPNGRIMDCKFEVKVSDKEPPAIQCRPDTIILLPMDKRGLIYNYKPLVINDNHRLDTVMRTQGEKSGCFLQLGEHPFTFTARDASGNTSECTYVVSVRTNTEVEILQIPNRLDKALNIGTDSIHYEHKATLNNCLLTAIIYDDGEEDGDSVSVVFNNQILVDREGIRVKENSVIKRYLVLNGNSDNFIAAKAWNTGRYGLNTLRIDIYEGYIENEKKELKNRKPVFSKVLHSKPGNAGGIILGCKW